MVFKRSTLQIDLAFFLPILPLKNGDPCAMTLRSWIQVIPA